MFDNVCKFLAENFSSDFARWLLGKPIGLTKLSPTELFVQPIRADALILLESEQTILHIEFQTQPDAEIPFRMADYRLRVYRRYPQKQMHQVVIYLKPTASPLVEENVFVIPKTRHEFEVIRLWEQPMEALLEFPGLLPFVVLSRTADKPQALRQVAQIIENLAPQPEQSNVAAATSILAGLVLDKEVIRQVLREEIMLESVIYQDIVAQATAKGKAEGRAEGKAQGRAEGIQEGETSLVLRLLKRRIGELDSQLEVTIGNLSVAQLEELGEALLDFSTQDDLLTWLASH
ncbi:Rpn family recombination-promoting nuclease/putative transposase [Calothrix rhizosoleniae]|uniref:Rpn family recombination-promoting nuclease/putative transposase n=1 Tax=Calothrix rhizosoleniae TaxID=888997 RepID=UPI000B49FD66|nr:Rpn family recombination-promoting nuclease/putative transposase [Calothrix rhizosoleniae]